MVYTNVQTEMNPPWKETRCNTIYLIIGGMPECVSSWIKYKDPARITRIQQDLIQFYENDFSKHNGQINSGRILMVFRSIVSQIAKPNEKFMYGAVREGGRARDFEGAIGWLVSAGMLNRVYNILVSQLNRRLLRCATDSKFSKVVVKNRY